MCNDALPCTNDSGRLGLDSTPCLDSATYWLAGCALRNILDAHRALLLSLSLSLSPSLCLFVFSFLLVQFMLCAAFLLFRCFFLFFRYVFAVFVSCCLFSVMFCSCVVLLSLGLFFLSLLRNVSLCLLECVLSYFLSVIACFVIICSILLCKTMYL